MKGGSVMRWLLIVLTAFLTLTATEVAQTQDPAQRQWCEAACRVAPSNAPPPGCNCEELSLTGEQTTTSTPAPLNPAPPAQTQPADPVEPAGSEPPCALACGVNPFTAPPHCDCNGTATPSGGGTSGSGGAGSGGISPESIAADGVVEVRELLDYMEQLYRERIAGVQEYYFLERMVVAQPQQAARSTGQARVMLASTAQSSTAGQGGLTGINTVAPVIRAFERHDDGCKVVKPLTQQELKERQASSQMALIPADARPGEREAAEAVTQDPTAFFGGLAEAADKLLGAGAGDLLRQEQRDMADTLGQDKEQTQDDAFAEDVLCELLELKKAQDRELQAAASSGGGQPQDFFERAREASSGGQEEVIRTLSLGHHEKGTLKFHRSTLRCASRVGCSIKEIWDYVMSNLPAEGSADDMTYCLIWRPTREAMADYQLPGGGRGSIANASGAELWLPITGSIMLAALDSHVESLRADPRYRPQEVREIQEEIMAAGGGEDRDRPVRMTAVFATPTAAGFSLQKLDRVYTKFEPVDTGAGPPMVEPHQIREELGTWICGEDVDIEDVFTFDHSLSEAGDANAELELLESAAGRCRRNIPGAAGALLGSAAADRFRSRFTFNQGVPNTHEEALMLGDELEQLRGPQD